jgi:hypothetical protein
MSHLSSLTIDALAGGHLEGGAAEAARAHIAACARCRGDVETAEAACAQFTREVLPRTLPTLRPQPWWRRMWPALVVPVFAAAALLLWIARSADVPEPDRDLRIKGTATFQVFAKRGDYVFAVRDAAKLAAGDSIRFVAGGPRYLLIASVDGAGKPTVYYPYGGNRSHAIATEPAELPGSIVLDAAPGPERLFALFSDQPLEAAVVTRALGTLGARGADAIRATATLEVAAAVQISIVFEKVQP